VVFGIRRIVPKPFQGEFGIFWGFEKSEGLFSRGKRGYSGRVVPARSASCSLPHAVGQHWGLGFRSWVQWKVEGICDKKWQALSWVICTAVYMPTRCPGHLFWERLESKEAGHSRLAISATIGLASGRQASFCRQNGSRLGMMKYER
jgi:hypothetical protein